MQAQESLESLRAQFREAVLASALSASHTFEQLCPEVQPARAEIDGCLALFHGAKDPANRAIWLGNQVADEGELEALEKFFRDRDEPTRISILDASSAQEFLSKLRSRGYQDGPILCTWWIAFPLPDDEKPSERVLADGISVIEIAQPQLELWARTVAAGFRETESTVAENEVEASAVRGFALRTSRKNCRPYLATIEAEPAGGGVLEIRDRVALVRSASTRFAHRRKGVQAALIAGRLGYAAKAGCSVAFSMADKGGGSERNLRRAGFQFLQEGCILSRP